MSHVDPPAILGTLGFLVGRFHGEGKFQRGGVTVAKDVIGRWEVGGHFLSLSMTALYRLRDAVADIHHAMAGGGGRPPPRGPRAPPLPRVRGGPGGPLG